VATTFYNDNDACIRWSHHMTLKAAHRIELHKISICEWVQDQTISVQHVPGSTNPADIFTKEMHDGAHFHQLRNSLVSRLSDFLRTSLLEVHHARQRSQHTVAPSAAHVSISFGASFYFTALASNTFCRSVTAISHLSSAGRHILCCTFDFVPSGLL
jgi:hypothetical protein